MAQWRLIAEAARAAGAQLMRDRAGGEAEFDRLLARYPNDGMVLLERGRARLAAGDPENARLDFDAAVRYLPLESYKAQARHEFARLPRRAQAANPVGGIPSRHPVQIPSAADLERAHAIFRANEPRAIDFDVTARLLEQALGGPHRLSVTVPTALLLQSWNFAYYQDGRAFDGAHFGQLDTVLDRHRSQLLPFRRRTLSDLQLTDEAPVKALFAALTEVVGSIGAAKALHLWAPLFFPLWDTPIAKAYGFDLAEPTEQYWVYMQLVRAQLDRLVVPPGLSALKALDEYNYCAFTKDWIPS